MVLGFLPIDFDRCILCSVCYRRVSDSIRFIKSLIAGESMAQLTQNEWYTTSQLSDALKISATALRKRIHRGLSLQVKKEAYEKYHPNGYRWKVLWQPMAMSPSDQAFFGETSTPDFSADVEELVDGNFYSSRQISEVLGYNKRYLRNSSRNANFPLESQVVVARDSLGRPQKQVGYRWDSVAWECFQSPFTDGSPCRLSDVSDKFNVSLSNLESALVTNRLNLDSFMSDDGERMVYWNGEEWVDWFKENEREPTSQFQEVQVYKPKVPYVSPLKSYIESLENRLTLEDVQLGIELIYQTEDFSTFSNLEDARDHAVAMLEKKEANERMQELMREFHQIRNADEKTLGQLARQFYDKYC
jgi:hypothetical protein